MATAIYIDLYRDDVFRCFSHQFCRKMSDLEDNFTETSVDNVDIREAIVCPQRRFGLECELVCNCAYNTSCYVRTGACPAGCAVGYTGVDCYTLIEKLTVTNPSKLASEEKPEFGGMRKTLKITCNADVVDLPPEERSIERLQISRTPINRTGFEMIADFIPSYGTRKTYIPGERDWTIQFYRGRNPRGTTIEWRINDLECSDAAIYQCTITYENSNSGFQIESIKTRSGQQELVPQATLDLHMSVTPSRTNNAYSVDENVVITCSAMGPKDLVFDWLKLVDGEDHFHAVLEGIHIDQPSEIIGEDLCTARHRSTLTVEGSQLKTGDHFFWCSAHNLRMTNAMDIQLTFDKADMGDKRILKVEVERGRVVMTCNADVVGLPSTFYKIKGLQISRRVGTEDMTVVAYFPHHLGSISQDIHTVGGRDWRFQFPQHEGTGQTFFRSVSIGWTINDAVCADAGIYQCTVTYDSGYGIAMFSRDQELRKSEICPKRFVLDNPSKLSSDKYIKMYNALKIKCNPELLGIPRGRMTIKNLTISRRLDGDGEMSVVAESYSPSLEGRHKRELIRSDELKWSVRWPKHTDAGIYECKIWYWQGGSTLISQKGQQYVGSQGPRVIMLPSSLNKKHFEDDTLNITCIIDGPQDLKIEWLLETEGYAQENEQLGKISTQIFATYRDEHQLLRHESTLSIKLKRRHNGNLTCDILYSRGRWALAKVKLSVLAGCSLYNKICLGKPLAHVDALKNEDSDIFPTKIDLETQCPRTKARATRCLKISKKDNCHTETSQMDKELVDFHCSLTKTRLLEYVEKSACGQDKKLFHRMSKRLKECDGNWKRSIALYTLDKETLCQINTKWTQCALRQARESCGEDVEQYYHYIWLIQDSIRYHYCQTTTSFPGCNDVSQCDNRIFGLDLESSVSDHHHITHAKDSLDTRCSRLKDFNRCFQSYGTSCMDQKYKTKVETGLELLNSACIRHEMQKQCWDCLGDIYDYGLNEISNLKDLIHFFMTNSHICSKLSECFDRSSTKCSKASHLDEFRLLSIRLCSTEGWELISNAQTSYCDWEDLIINHVDTTLVQDNTQGAAPICRTITDKLAQTAEIFKKTCGGSHIGTLVTQVLGIHYYVKYKTSRCHGLSNMCWQLHHCLSSFLEEPESKDWLLMFKKTFSMSLWGLCKTRDGVSKCYKQYAHYCHKPGYVKNVKKGMDLLDYQCTSGNKDSCPDTWVKSVTSETCIKLMRDQKKSWGDARAVCREEGGDLVKIINREMNEFLYVQIYLNYTEQPYWIGLNDRNVDGKFCWLDEEEKETSPIWAPGEPNNHKDNEDCVQINSYLSYLTGHDKETWHAHRCSKKAWFICEKHHGKLQGRSQNFFQYGIKLLSNKCEKEFYSALSPAEILVFEPRFVDVLPAISKDLCSRMHETETACLADISKFWHGSDYSYENHMFWLKVWLFIMGERYTSVREICYGVHPCPPWSMRDPSGSTCLTFQGQMSYHDAELGCRESGGKLVDIPDLNMFLAVTDFVTGKLSLWQFHSSKYSFWVNKRSAWLTNMFSSTQEHVCRSISRLNREHFWHSMKELCDNNRVYSVCEHPPRCTVATVCPAGWTLSPAGDLCVKAVHSPLLCGNYSTICDTLGARLVDVYMNRQMSSFIHGFLPPDPSKSFWIDTYNGLENKVISDEDLNKGHRERNVFSVPSAARSCAQISKGPQLETVRFESCSLSAGGICAKEPITCNAAWLCDSKWFQLQASTCIRGYHLKTTLSAARRLCGQEGGQLLDFEAALTRWQLLTERLSFVGDYWIENPDDYPEVECRSIERVSYHPNKLLLKHPTPEDCLSYKDGYICEKNAR